MSKSILIVLVLAAQLWAQDRVLRIYSLEAISPRQLVGFRSSEPDFALVGPEPRGLPETAWGDHERIDRQVMAQTLEELFTEVAKAEIDIDIAGHKLLVRTTVEGHARVARALELLEQQCTAPFEIGVRYLSLRAADVDDSVRSLLAKKTLTAADRKRIEKLDRNGGERGGVLSAPHGWWSTYRGTRRVTYLADFEVEIAQGSAIGDPVLRRASEGVVASVRPFLLQDGRALLRVVASAGELDKPFRRFRAGTTDLAWMRRANSTMVELEQADFRGCGASTEMLLRGGETKAIVMTVPDRAESRYEVLLFTLRKAPQPAPAGTLTVLPTGALTVADKEQTLAENEDQYHDLFLVGGDRVETLSQDHVEDHMDDVVAEEREFVYSVSWLNGSALLVRADAATAEKLKTRLAGLEAALVRGARLTLEFAVVRGGTRSVVGMLAGPVRIDHTAVLAGYYRRDYVGEYEVEVAQEARIADPVIKVAYSGLFAHARLAAKRGRGYRLELGLRVAALTEGIRVVLPDSGDFGPVQTVPVSTRKSDLILELTRGGQKTIDLGSNPFGTAGRLIATVRID